MPLWIYQHVPIAFFVFAFGSIVGSFINVVIYRMPAGMSVIAPPSRCPTCGARLSWRENLPIIGWLLVRGRCTHCHVRISLQYVLIEVTVALLFLGMYVAYFVAGPSTTGWWGQVGGNWFYYMNWYRASPMFVAHLFLIAALVAMTIIDSRTFTIPIQIPMVVIVVGFAAALVQPFLPVPFAARGLWPMAVTDWQWFAVAMGGMLGVILSTALLKLGVLRYSFADYDQYAKEGEVIADYPHARREMGVELVFLTPCIVGMVGGYLIGAQLTSSPPPVVIQSLGGAALGYLMGGGIIWSIRIVFSFLFGKEAMGLGDVHVLAAIGTVLGWVDPITIFFLAPFSGLLWVVLSIGLAAMLKRGRRELPFGPHLAVATLVVVACRPAVTWIQTSQVPPAMQPPTPGLIQPIQPGP